MAFQIKDFTSIVASMINVVRGGTKKITDFSEGAVIRTMLEAPAVEIEELYQQMFTGLREAIPAAIYPPFDFDLLPAQAAAVNAVFSTATAQPATQAYSIPAGFAIRAPGGSIQYLTQAPAVLAQGQTTVPVRVVANEVGTVGNAIAGSLSEMVTPISGLVVTNPGPVITGRDLETEAERKTRFQAFITSLARSHLAGIEFGAGTAVVLNSNGDVIETVRKVKAVEPFVDDPTQPLGYVDVYLWNGVDSATPGLLTAAQKIIDGYYDVDGTRVIGYKGAGVVVTAKAVVEQYQDTGLAIAMEDGYLLSDVTSQITELVGNYIIGLGIGETYVVSEVVALVKSLEGVYDVQSTDPVSNVVPGPNTKLLPGTVSFSSL